MAEGPAETLVGAAVLAVAGGFLFFAAQGADLSGGGAYELTASFRKADGVGVGGEVRVSGVKVGAISGLSLDPSTYRAEVRMTIRDEVKLPEDSSAIVALDGLLGGAYVAITPGASEFMLEPGDAIAHTQGSVNLMDLIGRVVTGGEGG